MNWRKFFWRGAFTSQLTVLLRLISGLWLFRLMFHYLAYDAFGFYTLLWSFLGYSIFLDFGLGYTAQKVTAEKLKSGDLEGLNAYLSSAFWFLTAVGVAVFAVGALLADPLLTSAKVAEANRYEFHRAYLVFLGALGVGFPLGFLPEILAGLQRVDLNNYAVMVSIVLNVATLTWGVMHGWTLSALILAGVVVGWLGPNAFAYTIARRLVPGLSLSPARVSPAAMRATWSFSVSAYLISCANVVSNRTDQVVISLTRGIGQLYLYQAGFKIADLFKTFCARAMFMMAPAAAQLHAHGDRSGQRALLKGSLRLTLLAIPPALLLALNMTVVIRFLTGLKAPGPVPLLVGYILLASAVSSLITDACAAPMLIMSGHAAEVARVQVLSATANIALSVLLVERVGLPGVALGTLIPGLLAGWLGIMPLAVRFSGEDGWTLARDAFSQVGPPVLLSCALVALSTTVSSGWGLLDLAWRGVLALLPLRGVAIALGRNLVRAPAPDPP
jgi:O-antigen/teichoic acid export membrane protein